MKPIVIVADSRGVGTCRSCGAAIEWAVIAATNRRMPFNPPIVLQSALHLDEALGTVRVDMDRTTSHFATCTDPQRWRKPR